MSVDIHVRSLDGWPRELNASRRHSPFSAGWDKTLRALRHELTELGASLVVVQLAVPDSKISVVTGWLKADANPAHPGVIIAADTKYGSLKWLCDEFRDWRDNVRAIVLTLERLRLADLYGVTRKGEQYVGWKMLPGPLTTSERQMTIEDAARFVGAAAGEAPSAVLRSKRVWQEAYRQASKKLHPDAANGQDPAAAHA